MSRITLATGCAVMALLSNGAPASAQSAGQPEVQQEGADIGAADIVVTAQRRSQRLQDVPVSISAVTSASIENSRVEDINQLSARVPGMSGQAGSTVQPRVVIRGISTGNFGIGGDSAIGVYLDDVFIGRSAGSLSNLFDISQIEVVRGPQGTLFGRNTTAGAISIKRNQPGPDFGGNARMALGNYNLREGEAALNLPLADDIYFRASGFYRERDGWIRNVAGGRDFGFVNTGNVHAALRYDGDGIDLTAAFDWERNRNSSNPYRNIRALPSPKFYTVASDITADQANSNRDIYMGSLRAEVGVGDWGTWTTIAAYREYSIDYSENTDGTEFRVANYRTQESQRAYSLESRLSFSVGDLEGVVGANYFKEKPRAPGSINYDENAVCGAIAFGATGQRVPSCLVVIPLITRGAVPGFPGATGVSETSLATGNYESASGFFDLTYKFADKWSATAGLRFNRDTKHLTVNTPPVGNLLGIVLGLGRPPIVPGVQPPGLLFFATNGPIVQRDAWNSLQPRFVLSYEPIPTLHLYASASRGFTAGGFNSLAPQGGGYNPESIWSYEVGAKGKLLDNLISYELAGYYYNYSNLQVQVQDPVALIRNAAKANGRGIELSVSTRVSGEFLVDGTLAYTNAKYGTYTPMPGVNYDGNSLQQSPKFTASISPVWKMSFADGSGFQLTGTLSYRTKQYFDDANTIVQHGYALLDARATYTLPGGNISLSAFGTNITKSKFFTGISKIESIAAVNIYPGQPAFYGLEAKVRF